MSTDEQKLDALARLGIARREKLAPGDYNVYLDALTALSPEIVMAACEALGQVTPEPFAPRYPSLGDLLHQCAEEAHTREAKEAARRLLPAPKDDESGPREFCPKCHDEPNGWYPLYCQGAGKGFTVHIHERHAHLELGRCDRKLPHGPHPWVVKCVCAPVNPVAAKAREREAKHVAAKASRKR